MRDISIGFEIPMLHESYVMTEHCHGNLILTFQLDDIKTENKHTVVLSMGISYSDVSSHFVGKNVQIWNSNK